MSDQMIQRVLVVGAGTMGQQIAFQCAAHGFDVTLVDSEASALENGMAQVRRIGAHLAARGALSAENAEAAADRVSGTLDLATAAATADIVSESVPEDPALKGRIFAELNELCPPHTLFTTNTSTLLPSMFARETGRPERFAALHFHLPAWDANVVDIMGHPGTAPETLAALADFARAIGQIPIVLERENSGYVFNAMFSALNTAAINLVASGVASIEDVDRAWMGIMKMPLGPGGWLDSVGLDTVYKITAFWAGITGDVQLQGNAAFLKRFIDDGRLGVKTGRGFYEYPEPAFRQPDFLTGSEGDEA